MIFICTVAYIYGLFILFAVVELQLRTYIYINVGSKLNTGGPDLPGFNVSFSLA